MSAITKEFTKEQLITWANNLIEETQSDISISRTDAHAESYRAQLALLEIALASLEAEPVSFDDLRDAVAEVSGGPAMEWSQIYKGHQVVPFINFNSLARIVDKFRTAPPAPVSVPDDVNGPLAYAYKELTTTFMRNHIGAFERYGIYPDGSAGIQAMRIALDGMERRAAMLQGANVSLISEGNNHVEHNLDMVNLSGGGTEMVKDGTFIDEGTTPATLQGAEPVTTAYKLPPHVYRELVNALRDTAVKYQGCQQLREQISETLSAVITHTPHCNKAAPETSLFNDVVCCVCLGRHPGPIDHGYRAECECAGCKATARICAELAASAQVDPDCWCRTCRPVKLNDMRFVVCPDCGNKRCPHANDHRNACTGSNEPGQEGSAYPASTQQHNEENAKSPSGIQTAPAQDSLPKNAEARCGNSPVIPDGWVMVPVEPTEDMIVEGFESEPDESFSDEKEWEAYEAMSGCQQAAHRAKLCWAAMIAAVSKQGL